MKLRPAPYNAVTHVQSALRSLQHAAALLRSADCPKTLERTRLAISSCYGALRHAERRERAQMRTPNDLLRADGRVAITHVAPDGAITVVGRTATVADAEEFLALSATIDPDELEAGNYGIDPPEELC